MTAIRVGIDVSSLADAALTGIPLSVESLLREYFASPGEERWVLAGSPAGSDLTGWVRARGFDLPGTAEVVPMTDLRLGSRFPGFGQGRFRSVVDGRLLLPLGNLLSSGRVPRVDVFHHTAILRISSGRARRNIVTIYDLTTRFFPEAHHRVNIREWERVFRFARDRADMVVTDSESAREDIVRYLGVAPSRVRAIPLGVRTFSADPSLSADPSRQDRYGLEGRRFVLCVGSLEPRKNVPRLIEAFSSVVRRAEFSDVCLVLTGARLHGASAIEEAIRRAGIGDRVVITGYVADRDLAWLMQNCTSFVYPSLYEGFGLPVVEAMAMGAPVATSDVSALPEVAGDAALLFDPNSSAGMAEAMVRLLTEPELAWELRRRGRERAALFTWKRCADEHRRLYREVAA
ncbi:MAG: glycosyltransferase family 1 protein [Capsulimonadales bacterium]|nr:glycosyltransferase family 1 protein [Capsulimonadales bacterium]